MISFFIAETKLKELSEVVGNYEKLRQQDQQVISNLKERLSQIDIPKTNQQMNSPESETDNQTSELKEQVLKLKSLLRLNWSKTEISYQNEQLGKLNRSSYEKSDLKLDYSL